LSVGPVSRGFSVWASEFVGSVLSRAEMAARYLVIAEARRMVAGNGGAERRRLPVSSLPAITACETELSLCDLLRGRLKALQAVLMDLPRHARRFLRWIEKQNREECAERNLPSPCAYLSISVRIWRLPKFRIDRPPDRASVCIASFFPPSGCRTGGEGGWGDGRR